MKRCIALLLTVLLTITGCFSLNVAAAATEDNAQIVSADMSLDSAKNNAQGYFSNDDWKAEYPDGLYVIEYNSYEITEGGPDPENPEDIYLGIVIYRIGGNSQSATLKYNLITVSGDNEMYPDCMGTLDFAPQQVTATAKVRIPNDNKRNGNQLLMMTIADVSSGMISDASTTMIKVFDDEPYVESVVSMVAEKAVADKSDGGIQVTIKRTENDTDYCTVLVKTSDDTAKAGSDYRTFEEEVVFAAGVTEQKVIIPLVQSDDKFTDPKYFNLTMENIRGGVAGKTDSIRLGVTNCLEKGKGSLIDVSSVKADMVVDDNVSLVDSAKSVLNENDTLDRTDMLRAAVGAANGKAVTIIAQTGSDAMLQSTGDTGYWTSTLQIPPSEFEVLQNSGKTWSYNSDYDDDNENLLVATKNTYNLNLYNTIGYSYKSKDGSGTFFTGNPNIALGYLDNTGHSYKNLGACPYGKTLKDNEKNSMDWMKTNDIYILKNHLQTNVDTGSSTSFETENLGAGSSSRYINTTGREAYLMKPFYFVYNVDDDADDNHFKIYNTELVRTVIPFTVFEKNEGYRVITGSNPGVEFKKDSYKWTITVDDADKKGGVVVNSDSGAPIGFYAGSELKVTFSPETDGASVPVPQILYLTDQNGNIHNFSKKTNEKNTVSDANPCFYVTLETNMSNSTDLKNDYLLTDDQLNAHNNLLTNGGCINSLFNGNLSFECQYVVQQGVEISYKEIPHIYEDLTNMSESSQKSYILDRLGNVVKFYKDGKELSLNPDVNLEKMTLYYDIVEFDKVVVNPLVAGDDVKITSNLYSLEYKTITKETSIERFVCAQIPTAVRFLLTYYDTDYVDPDISLVSTSVSQKQNGEFKTTYTANYIDDNIPFEVMFSDRSQAPAVSYYTMNFVISDVYIGEKSDDMAIKDYPVNVYAGDIDSRNGQKLLSFTYRGGGTYSQAGNLSLNIEDGVFSNEYRPEVQLLSYSSVGYEYVMRIPVYYNYQNPNDVTYPAILKGGQGITIEVGNFNNGDGDSHNEVVASMEAKDSQYVCQKLMDVKGVASEQYAPGSYYTQQEDFYTYTDHVINANTSPVTLDLTSIGLFISQLYALGGKNSAAQKALCATGNGVQLEFLDNQMSIILRLGVNSPDLSPKETKPLPGIEMHETAYEIDADELVGFDMPVVDPVTDSSASTIGDIANNYQAFTVNFFFEARVDLSYNSVRNEWDFSAFTAGVNGGFAFSKSIPIPAAANLVYATFSISGSLGISSGFSAVKDYVDLDGNVNYAFSWNGITFAPSFAVSIGAGVGLTGILSLEAGGSAEFAAAVTFGQQEVTPKLAEFDLDTGADDEDTKITDKYVGNWETCVVANTMDDEYLSDGIDEYFYHNTYVISQRAGDYVVIEGEGTAFQLTGVTKADGGEIKVTVYTEGSETPVQDPQILSLKSDTTQTHNTLFEWKMDDFDNPDIEPVNIKVVVENYSGKVILDSAKLYREDNRTIKETPASFDSASARISFYVKFTIAFFSLNLEPAYMLIQYSDIGDENVATITLGTVYYSKTWDVSGNEVEVARANENLPLVVLGDSGVRSNEEINYFDTGEFGLEKKKTLIQGDVFRNSKTQVINYKGTNIPFFTEVIIDPVTSELNYGLYCNLPDYGNVLVCDSAYVSDFKVYIDENSELCVEISASDSTVKSVISKGDNKAQLVLNDNKTVDITDSSDLTEILQRTCIRVATYNDNGTFKIKTIDGTDNNSLHESLPETAVTTDKTVVFFVEDDSRYNADFMLDWKGFDKTATTVADIENLMNSMFSGQGSICYSVKTGDNITAVEKLSLKEDFEARFDADILKGIRIIDVAAVGGSDGSISLAYITELPGVVKNGYTGVLKELHYRKGTFAADGSLSFGEALVVDSVVDYDKKTEEVLGADELTSKYYNESTGEIYDNPYIRNLQMENAVLHGADEVQPCIFYQTNSGINAVSYSSLLSALEGKNSGSDEKSEVSVLNSGHFDDYVVAVSATGIISIIYIDNSGTSSYTDTLNIIDYDADYDVWNHPRQLTYSDIFDAEALRDRSETYGMTIDNFSAFVDGMGNVSVAFKSNYAPFTYDYGVPSEVLVNDNAPVDVSNKVDGYCVNENGEVVRYMVTPMLDFNSSEARSDIYMISFTSRVTAIDVTGFDMLEKIFAPNEEVALNFDITNTGDTIIDYLSLNLYTCDADRIVMNPIVSTVLSANAENEETKAGLLAGDSIEQYMSFETEGPLGDNSLLCLEITDRDGNVLFDSYDSYIANTNADETDDKEVTYHIIRNSPELDFEAIDVDIDAYGEMSFKTDIANIGTEDMKESAVVYFKVYTEDSDGNLNSKTLFSFTQYPLKAGQSEVYSDTYMVNDYIKNGELKYSFEIVTNEEQFETDNDSTGVVTGYQVPDIQVVSATVSSVLHQNSYRMGPASAVNLSLGDGFEMTSDVLSERYGNIHLRAYEVGSDCLSIDNAATGGKIRVKAIGIPENGRVKLLLNVKGTTIFRIINVYITDKDMINFDSNIKSSGFNVSDKVHTYAKASDVFTTAVDKSSFSFDFYGDDLSIYGDRLINGGEFMVTATDKSGKVVLSEKISTKADLNDYGMLLYKSEKLDLGKYTVNVQAILKDGESLALDHAKFTINTDDADVTPFAYAGDTDEVLDAPLVKGRARKAHFNLTFNSRIKTAEGVNLKDISVLFDEYELTDGRYVATGNTVTFTGEEIKDGKVLVLGSELSSKPGVVLKYVLKDSKLPADMIVTAKGTAVITNIPDYDKVSYVLKESGILSVTVAEDKEMPDGSVQKSVNVKFMTSPDVSRLEGTKLLYNTVDSKGEKRVVEFKFVKLTADPRVAVYRADTLELENDEMSKVFSFDEGIVLGEKNFVLVTAQGDYLDNNISQVITDKTKLDISYSKLEVTESQIAVITDITENGLKNYLALYAEFEDKIDISELTDSSKAFVTLTAEFTDKATENSETQDYILYADSISQDGRTICFKAEDNIVFSKIKNFNCSLKENFISYTDENASVVSVYDGIAVNPQLADTQNLSFNTAAYIVSATPFFEGGSFKARDNVLCAEVIFSGEADTETLKDTTLKVIETASEYDATKATDYELTFQSAEVKGEGDNAYTVAVYKYISDTDTVSFNSNQYSKSFRADKALTIKETSPVKSADGKEVYSSIILERKSVNVSKLKAEGAELRLVENGTDGYKLGVCVSFSEDILAVITEDVYAMADMTVNGESVPVYLALKSAENNVLYFECDTAFSLKSGEITTFTLRNRFTSPATFVTDSLGIPVCELVEDGAELIVDNSLKGRALESKVTLVSAEKDKFKVSAKVRFDEKLNENSFENAEIKSQQVIYYSDGSETVVEAVLVFAELVDENTALFTAELTVPDDASATEFSLGTEITPYSGSCIYNRNRTIILSTEVPVSEDLELNKTCAKKTAFFVNNGKEKIESLSDVEIYITYPENVVAENLEGITLKVGVRGIKGITDVDFKAIKLVNNNILVFAPEEDVTGEYASVVTLSLKNSKLTFAEGSALYSKESGISVSTEISDEDVTLLTVYDDVVVPPADTKPSETAPTETTVEIATEEIPHNTTSTEADKTEKVTEAAPTENTSDSQSGDWLTTGANFRYVIFAAIILMAVSVAVVLILRKKKA